MTETNFFPDVAELLTRAEHIADEETAIEAGLFALGEEMQRDGEAAQIDVIARDVKELEKRRDDLESDDDLREGIAKRLTAIGKGGVHPEEAAAEFDALVRRFAALWPAARDPDSQHFVAALFGHTAAS
jgi:predicted phage gp36 major capsid-like protein